MAVAEIPFEYLALSGETTRGTAITTPTWYLGLDGMIKPRRQLWRPQEARGTLIKNYRSVAVRNWAEWEASGGLDQTNGWLALQMVARGGLNTIVPSSPNAGVYLWTFNPSNTSDNLQSFTMWWGDPSAQIFRSKFAMADEAVFAADASGTEGVTLSLNGMAHFPEKVSAPSLPAQSIGELFAASDMQVWIDTSSAIGTTEITGRIIGGEVRVPTGLVHKYLASTDKNYTRVARDKRAIGATVRFELADMVQYDLWAASTALKMRIRFNGPVITGAFKYYVQFDIYGPFEGHAWGAYENVNRTIELTLDESQYNAAAGNDWQAYVQNNVSTVT